MYCPNGTEFDDQYKCPMGTFNNKTHLKSAEECTPCPGGYYCDELGQTTYHKKCSAGKINENFTLIQSLFGYMQIKMLT